MKTGRDGATVLETLIWCQKEAQQAMEGDNSINSLAGNSMIIELCISLSGEEKNPTGKNRMTYQVRYTLREMHRDQQQRFPEY